MAHQLKYYKEIESHGHLWRVEILQETEDTLTPMEIGPVLQGLRLVMQGDQADIDTPIVKTSLEMSFVDAPDLEEERKCGYWEEFYTSSATEYMVILRKDGVKEWAGYVTPDSFSETLQYRGSVTIIARDNLGSLQDYDAIFKGDEFGLISFHNILKQAMNACGFAMYLDGYAEQNAIRWPRCTDSEPPTTLSSAKFNVSAFRGKTMWEAVEDVLYATGCVLRFVGSDSFKVQPLRSLGFGDMNLWGQYPTRAVRFAAYGHRELHPAVKSIRDTVDFELDSNIIDSNESSDDYGSETVYTYGSDFTYEYDTIMPVHAVTSGIFKGLGIENTILLNPFKYPIVRGRSYGTGGDIHDSSIVYVCSNLQGGTAIREARKASFSLDIPAGEYKIAFDVNKAVSLYNDNTMIGYADYANAWSFSYEAQFTGNDGSVLTLNNRSGTGLIAPTWQKGNSNGFHQTHGEAYPTHIESPVLYAQVPGRLTVKLRPATLSYNTSSDSKGGYLGIANLSVEAVNNATQSILKTLRINTLYKETNNVVLSRSPRFAPNPSKVLSYKQIRNNIYSKATPEGSDSWVFNDNDIPQPLSVLIHQQLLAYYSKPNNVLTGELVTEDPTFDALYEWQGKLHLLTSGTLNIVTGRMENAILREYIRYDRLWETWVEKEQIMIDYSQTEINIVVHTNRALAASDIQGLPSWLTMGSIIALTEGSIYRVLLSVMDNATGAERRSKLKIDTAYVFITQRAAGDYGIDYGKDYS